MGRSRRWRKVGGEKKKCPRNGEEIVEKKWGKERNGGWGRGDATMRKKQIGNKKVGRVSWKGEKEKENKK